MSRLENLLEQHRLMVRRRRPPRSDLMDEDDSLEASSVPWDDLVLIFIDHRLKDWQPPGPPPCGGKNPNMESTSSSHLFLVSSLLFI